MRACPHVIIGSNRKLLFWGTFCAIGLVLLSGVRSPSKMERICCFVILLNLVNTGNTKFSFGSTFCAISCCDVTLRQHIAHYTHRHFNNVLYEKFFHCFQHCAV